jgi:PAS domain S-box-containing protein
LEANEKPSILVVESDDFVASEIAAILEGAFGADVEHARTVQAARQRMAGELFDAITLGYAFGDGTGLELLADITAKDDHPPVIMVTGQGSEEIASWAIRHGTSGYVLKNEEMEPGLVESVQRALAGRALQRVRDALHETESFYQTLFDDSIEALFIETLDGVIEDANRAAEEMLGYGRGELNGMVAAELVPPDMRRDFEDALAELLAGKTIAFQNLTRDGRAIPVYVRAKELMTRRGPRFIVSVDGRDPVSRIAPKRPADGRFNVDAIDRVAEVFILIDRQKRYVFWNRALCEVTGYSEEELTPMAPADLHPGDDFNRLGAAIDIVFDTCEVQRVETHVLRRDGVAIPYDISLSLVRDDAGEPAAVVAIGRDVSDRKRAEESLRNMVRETNQRREEITALLESTRLVLEKKDFGEAARDIFRLCKKLIGASVGYVSVFEGDESKTLMVEPEQLNELFEGSRMMPVLDLHGTDFELGKAIIENDIGGSELAQRLPDGHFRVSNLLLAPLVVEKKTVGLIGLANKKGGFSRRDALMASAFGEVASLALQNARYLELLSESEERFRSVAETANEAIICADSQVNIVFWNPGAEEMFGYGAEEVLGRSLTLILPERMRNARLDSLMKVASGDGGKTYEALGLRKDGQEFFMEMSRSTPWRVADDFFFTAIIRDITQRRQAEEALKRSEADYRAVVEDQTELIVRFGTDGGITFVNEANARYYGKSREEMLSLGSFLDVVPEEDREIVMSALAALTPQEPVLTREQRTISGDGDIRWQQWTTRAFFDGEGNVVEYQSVGRDVTDRRAAEDALKESEHAYRLLFDSAPDVIYSIDEKREFTAVNQAFVRLTGYSAEELIGRDFAPITHPLDLQKAIDTYEQARSGSTPEPYELRIKKKDGTYIVWEFISKPLLKRGEPSGEFGIARDITARKEAERALAESEELYRALLATSPDAVVVTDLDFKIQMVSDRAIEQQRAGSAEELIGMSTMEVLLPTDQQDALDNAESTLRSGLGQSMDFVIRRRDGTTFTGEVMASLLRDADGNPRAFIATIRDVSERKTAERELQVLNTSKGLSHRSGPRVPPSRR